DAAQRPAGGARARVHARGPRRELVRRGQGHADPPRAADPDRHPLGGGAAVAHLPHRLERRGPVRRAGARRPDRGRREEPLPRLPESRGDRDGCPRRQARGPAAPPGRGLADRPAQDHPRSERAAGQEPHRLLLIETGHIAGRHLYGDDEGGRCVSTARRTDMKISAFHLMPHRELPQNFERRYPSVWGTPPWWELADAERVGQYYNWTLDELLHAARAGFDGVCTNEHHQNAYGFMPSPNLMGSVLAKQTNGLDVAIVQMGMTLPTTSPPIRVAEEDGMIDCISGGRLVARLPPRRPLGLELAHGP